ncbi:MAG: PKD domain-containing protein [Bacteroidota bacterium]
MKHLFTLFLIIAGYSVIGQNYNMTNGTISTCSGTFYDSGGNGGGYQPSENYTQTFCPSTPGSKIILNFTAFDTESTYEHMYIYDGNSTAGALIGSYTGSSGPGIVQASAGNASGCLTIVFTSDGSVEYTGWAATISCSTPCQTITSNIVSSSPAVGAGSIIRVCKNQPVTFNGSGTFSGSSAGAVYTWNFGNGTTATGTSASVTYTAAGAYFVNLGITAGGCSNTNNINQVVQVSTTPTSTTSVANPTVCLGQSTTVTGTFSPVPFVVNCTPPVSGTTFLPDGSGASYSTAISVNCFNAGQTLTAANQIQDICLNMEHSYQGDLSIQIICPNGQVCNLKDYPGGSYNYLGAPLDDPAVGPGVGAYYCFSMSGTVLLCNGPTTANQGNPPYTSITAGTYLPTGNFSSLVGCPLNGPWTIKVTDNLLSDNGYIFNWDLNFAPGLTPAANSSFTPNIVSQTWSGANITSSSGNNITVTPTSTGTQCYTLTAVDNFNCSYTTTQCLNVINGPFAGTSNTMAACSSAGATNLYSLLGTGVSTTGTWSGPAPALTGGYLGTFNPGLYTAGTYNYTYTVPASGGCPASSAVIAVTIRPNPAATLTFTNPSCGNNNGIIVINNTSSGGQTISSFASSAGTLSGQTVTGLAAGTDVITLTNNFGCTFTVSATLSNSPPITDVALTPNNIICGTGTGSITIGAVTGGTAGFTYAVNGGAFSASPPVTGLSSGTYSISVKDANGCIFTKTVAITVTPGPTAIAGNVTPATCSSNNGVYTVTGVTGGTPAYSFSVDAVATGSVTNSLSSATHTILVRDANGCTFSTTFVVSNLPGPTSANVTTVSASCGSSNGSATVTSVAGGSPTYQYSFNGGGFSTTNNIGGLTAGTKNVVIKDANNCTFTVNFTISNLSGPTSSISASSSVTCNGGANGTINVSTTGGTGPYGYTVTPGGTSNTTGIFTGLTAQSYTINVRDASGCLTSITQVINQPTALTLGLTPTAVSCNGASTGSIASVGANGTGALQYALNGGAYQASGSFTGLTAGTYSVTVKDANNCTLNQTTIITQPTALALTFTTSPNSCLGAAGGVTVSVTGGVPAYSYSIDAVAAANPATGLSTGTHTTTVRDANGCIINGTFNVGILSGPSGATVTTTNASCGSANGSATVTATTGGVLPYQYSFNGGGFSTTTNVGSLTAGQQTLTVRDANSCTLTVLFNINNTGSPSSTLTAVSNVACNGASTGSLTVGTSGGTAPYSYTLTPGSIVNTTGIFTGLTAQAYNISVKDAVGCITSVTATVTQPTPLTLTLNPFNVSCNAGTNGSVTAVAGGGTTAYQYSLNGGAFQAGASFTGLTANTYSVTLKDANNCVLTRTATITQPTALGVTFATAPNSCAGSVGSVTISATGGSPAYTYTVDGASTGNTSSPLTTGVHNATVRDAQGCVITGTFSIIAITGPSSGTVVTSNAACGSATGASTITGVTGGTAAYQYSFDGSPFATGTIKTGLSSGAHTVVVLDANTCTLSIPYTIANNGSPSISLTASTNVLCNGGSTGSLTVTATGGSGAPYTYTLTSPFQTNNNGQFTGLPSNIYSINAKDVAGCLTSMTVNISQPTALTLSPTSIAAKCFGTSTGTVNVTGSGGTPGYQYQINGTGFQTAGSFTAVPANTHIIQVRDANGCTATQTVTVTQPTALADVLATQNANCTAANGSITATPSGGTSPYTYAWTGGGGSGSVTTGLVSGTYSVTVTDNNGCTLVSSATIGNTPGGTAAITGSTNITCNGANNGILTANMVTAGTAPFTYSWTPTPGAGQGASTATNLAPGTYTCKITDFYGCIATAIGSLTQPTPLTAIMNSNNVKCFGTATGTVSAAGTGGTGPYTYNWTTLPSTLTTVNNVAIGTYTCQITDVNNCTISPTISVTQPSSITLTSSVTAANCNQANGSATVTASGGTPAYTYTWTSGSNSPIQTGLAAATYTINVKDANNCIYTVAATVPNLSGPSITITSFTNVSCFGGNDGVAVSSGTGGTGALVYNWSGGQITPTATNLLAGVKTVTVTDSQGCIASASVTITQPPVLTVSITPNNPKCFGASNGYGLANAFGGTLNYTYAWTSSGGSNPSSNLYPAGSYAVNITDAKGCVATASMTLVNPPAMVANITSTNVSCFNACNGIAVGTTTNNIGVVTYHWVGGSSPVTAQTVAGLCAGVYTLTATDQNTCTASAQVIITQPTQVTANIALTGSITCSGGSNGFAQVTPGGGTGAYTYTWTGAAAGSSANATNLPAGTYSVTVGDANGCTATTQATIIQPAPLATTLTTTNPKCFGSADGTGNVAFSGGAGLPQFQWFPGLQNGTPVNNLTAGAHTVTITYNTTCSTSLTFTLTQPSVLTAVTSATSSNCGQSNGDAIATVTGGTGPYTYLWSNGPTTLNNNNILANAYVFTVTDFNLCQVNAGALVNDIAGPTVVVTGTTAVKCFNGADGAATTTITGGVQPYIVAWNNNAATTPIVINFNAGLHLETVTDAAGCVGTASVMIGQPTQLVSAISSFSNVTCFGLTNGQATMSVNGGTPGYSYTWTPGLQTSAVMANVGANTYTCDVKDANNCPTSKVVTISQPQALVMAASSFSNISCFGGNNGQISTTVQGGTPAYVYSWSPAQTNSGVLGGLGAGGYSLSVTDANNCSINANFTILEPSALTSAYTSVPARCGLLNGSATVTVGGGTPTYTLNWNANAQQGPTATGMGPGTNWNCTITDSKGCTKVQAVTITNAASPVITSVVANPTSCYSSQDGSIVVNYNLGTPSYTVAWSNPINPSTQVTAGLSQTVTGVGFGAYTMTVTDSYGCTTSSFANVGRPPFLTWAAVTSPTICYGQNAQISANGLGGTAPYTYTWTPAFNNTAGPHTVNPTTTTLYNVNVTDANNCTVTPTVVTVNVTAPLAVIANATSVCDGEATILTPTITSPGRGLQYITYAWSNNATTSITTVTGNNATTPNHYTVTVSDGCTAPTATAIFTIDVNPLPTGTISANTTTLCAPGAVTFSATTGSGNTFVWYNDKNVIGTSNPLTYNVPKADSITVKVHITNQFGCSIDLVKPKYVIAFDAPTASFIPNPQTTSILDPTILFTNTSTGGSAYSWSFGDPTALNGLNFSTQFNTSHTYNYVGTYTVDLVVTSLHGCTAEAAHVVEITPDFALYIPNSFTPDGNGVNDFFQPMGIGVNEDNYRLDIFDRWGESIFTSNNFRKGWDGSVKGSGIAEQGVYIYKVMVYDMQGNKHPFVGHVTLLTGN